MSNPIKSSAVLRYWFVELETFFTEDSCQTQDLAQLKQTISENVSKTRLLSVFEVVHLMYILGFRNSYFKFHKKHHEFLPEGPKVNKE